MSQKFSNMLSKLWKPQGLAEFISNSHNALQFDLWKITLSLQCPLICTKLEEIVVLHWKAKYLTLYFLGETSRANKPTKEGIDELNPWPHYSWIICVIHHMGYIKSIIAFYSIGHLQSDHPHISETIHRVQQLLWTHYLNTYK